MTRTGLLLFAWLAANVVTGQVRLQKLVLQPKEVYELKGADILVVDTLIMMDSSILRLNKLKAANFIHAKQVVFYKGSLIDGKGVHGLPGRIGRPVASTTSPCANGVAGRKGTEGTHGGHGINLYFSFTDIVVHGPPTIDVSGGDAGDGGDGGSGGGGGAGTRLCSGGSGGTGGPGSNGGNGGNSGSITFQVKSISELRYMLGDRIIIHNYGGNAGNGGEGGSGGYAGLSPTGNNALDGKQGKKGGPGQNGGAGKAGSVQFESK